jgi:hypothetical protein
VSGPDRFHDSAARELAAALWNQYWRIGAAGLVALAGLSLIAFAPAGLALGVQQYTELQDSGERLARQQLGAEVKDSEVGFVVHHIRCGPASPPEATHGRLCEVLIGVRNHGRQPVTVPGNRQLLAGPEGLRHLPVPGDPEPFGTLAPGAAATAVLTYDLPEHAELTHVQVHGRAHSDGEAVGLSGPPLPR